LKGWKVVLVILLVLIADQVLKVSVKTSMYSGEEVSIIGNWFKFHFTENKGMAFGLELGGEMGKLALSLFRILAVIGLGFIINKLIKEKAHWGLVLSVGLILAGALGNIIDSAFYGVIFENSDIFMKNIAKPFPEEGGYAGFLHGNVVDMFYFPLFRFPSWVPWLGNTVFFGPIFNLADVSISSGVFIILLFQKRFFSSVRQRVIDNSIENTTNHGHDI